MRNRSGGENGEKRHQIGRRGILALVRLLDRSRDPGQTLGRKDETESNRIECDPSGLRMKSAGGESRRAGIANQNKQGDPDRVHEPDHGRARGE